MNKENCALMLVDEIILECSVYVCQHLEITDIVKTHKISQIIPIKIWQNSDKKVLIALEKKLKT